MQNQFIRHIIVSLVFTSSLLVAQKKSEIIDFYGSDCDSRCFNDKGIQDIHLEKNNTLFLNFNYEGNCGNIYGPTLIRSANDTLILTLHSVNKPWSNKGGTQAIELFNKTLFCDCAYNYTIKISNIKQVPKVIVLNEQYHINHIGFVDFEYFEELKKMNYENNSNLISYQDLQNLLGTQRTSETFNSFLKKVGNDFDFDEGSSNFNYEFKADYISIYGNLTNGITNIYISSKNFKGSLPSGISIGSNINDILPKMQYRLYQKNIYYIDNYNDERVIKSYKYCFENNFIVRCDENDNITDFEFSLKNND